MPRLFLQSLAALVLVAVAGCGASKGADPGQPVVVEEPAGEPQVPEEEPEEETPPPEGELVVSDDTCTTDEDCVAGGCCHAATCVARQNAPTCEEVMCTQECRYGTLDCGGACLCHEGRCAARLSEAPSMLPRE